MPTNRTKFAVDVPLDPDNFPSTDKTVIYDASEGSFALGAGGAGVVEVGPQSRINPFQTLPTFQYGTFARSNDSTESQISGSQAIALLTLGAEGTGTTGRQQEFRIYSGASDPEHPEDVFTFGTLLPFRIQNEGVYPPNGNGTTGDYNWHSINPVACSIEYVESVRLGSVNAGQQNILNIQTPQYIGSSSYRLNSNGIKNCLSRSFSSIKIDHTVTSIGSGITQHMTHTFVWTKNTSGHATCLVCNTVENAACPAGKVIVDPSRTTGSFDAEGGLNLNVYHYDIDDAYHVIRYKTL